MKTCFLASITFLAVILSVSSCDKIEENNRSVTVKGLHPVDFDYHIGVGLNSAETVVSWDTAGEVTLAFDAKVGDAIYYNMTSQAPMSGLNINIEGSDKLNLNLQGPAPNGTSGFLIVD